MGKKNIEMKTMKKMRIIGGIKNGEKVKKKNFIVKREKIEMHRNKYKRKKKKIQKVYLRDPMKLNWKIQSLILMK